MGLDPNNITYDALFNRLLEIVLANITLANMFALVGAIFLVATLLMQTIVPLRVANRSAACSSSPMARSRETSGLFLYLLLLPINAIRLRQMLDLIKRARIATEGDTSFGMAKTFMTELRRVGKGALAPCPPSAIRIRAADGGHAIALPTLRAMDKATIGASAEDRRDYKLLSRCKNTGMC